MISIYQKTFQSADASTSQTGASVDTETCVSASVQAIVTGTATGTIKLQGSNDPTTKNLLPATASNFTDIPGTSTNVSGTGSYLIFQPNLCYNFIRVVYTFTSGTGTITANTKALGF